jgi:hypothetical protein
MKPGTMQRTCSICGEVDIVMIPPLRHDYETVEVAPTCTTMGYKTYTCKRCGHSYTDEIPALGHDYKAVKSIAQNCVTDGYIRYTCSICGDTYDKIVPADGVHSNSFIRNVEPTCTEKGYALYICDDCGAETRKDYVEALGHVWGKWNDVHPAECEIEGTRESTCTRCGEKEIRVIPASGHDWDIDVEVVEPTCTEGGYTIHTCNACGTTRKDNFTGALGHSYVDGICTRCNNDKRGVIYYGVSTIPPSYNSSFILGLDHKAASDSHLESISVTPLEDEYIYYCSPTAFGDCNFAYNNFVGGFTLIIEGISLTNAGGKTEAYNIYKSNQANLGVNGAITITIKEMG